MKILLALLIIVSFSQCASVTFEQNPPFQVTDATYQNWFRGQSGVHGVNVKIFYTANKTIEFDSIYFEKRGVRLQIKNSKTTKLVVGYFVPNKINDIILDANSVKESQNSGPTTKKTPFQLKDNEAVISYKIRGKIKYFKILFVKKEKTLFFP